MAATQKNGAHWDTLWFNATVATMNEAGSPFGLLENGAIAIAEGKIVWVGAYSEIAGTQLDNCINKLDCQGLLITPGLIDCHTHLVYAGNRVNEFELRLHGASYAEIAQSGGGIVSTVEATRDASENELFRLTVKRLESFLNEGVTTVEIKSGYGLDLENESKMLRVARRIGDELAVDVVTSFLGAHALPAEYWQNSDAYIDHICDEMLPAIASQGLADHVDAFCENIAFSAAQVKRVFLKAQEYGLPIKLHAEQLSDQKGAVLAASMNALSVDHVEFLAEQDVPFIKAQNTVPVLLPGAYYFLGETKLPPIEAFRQHSVSMAIASDSNPGSSPVSSLLLMLNMACTLFKLTPEEALAGVTRNAAKALGLGDSVGIIKPGMLANLVLWDVNSPAELSYKIGSNPCIKVMYRGEVR